MALEHKLPEYHGVLATVGNEEAPVLEKPDYPVELLAHDQTIKPNVSVVKEEQNRLPETGEGESETAIFLAGVSLALSAALLTAKRKED
jgi:beta-galactosidase